MCVVNLIHPPAGLLAQLLELAREPFADLSRASLDLAPVARLNLQTFCESTLKSTQSGGIGMLDGCVDEFVEKQQGIVQTNLCDVAWTWVHHQMIKRRWAGD